jgi:hypothetical protein
VEVINETDVEVTYIVETGSDRNPIMLILDPGQSVKIVLEGGDSMHTFTIDGEPVATKKHPSVPDTVRFHRSGYDIAWARTSGAHPSQRLRTGGA